jgi:energy-coupling factor transporter ATP-binding protein EcfA2
MIEAHGLTKKYGDKTAVDNLSFTVRPGIVTGFLGPNGAGKSTTMRMIIDLDNPTSGTVPPMMVNARTARWLPAGWTAAWFAGMAWHGGLAWHLFVQGAQALADADDPAGGLHLYVVPPALQIGPLAFLVTECLRVLGGRSDLLAAQVLGTARGAYILWQAGRLGRRFSPWLVVFFVPVWMYLAVASVHLDDVLALVGIVAALATALAGWSAEAGLLLGLAVDAKRWALGCTARLLMLPGWRTMARAALTTVVAVVAGWLPFFDAEQKSRAGAASYSP